MLAAAAETERAARSDYAAAYTSAAGRSGTEDIFMIAADVLEGSALD